MRTGMPRLCGLAVSSAAACGTARVAPLIALGLDAADISATAKVATPLQANTVNGLSAVVQASLGLHVRLIKRLGLVLETELSC